MSWQTNRQINTHGIYKVQPFNNTGYDPNIYLTQECLDVFCILRLTCWAQWYISVSAECV